MAPAVGTFRRGTGRGGAGSHRRGRLGGRRLDRRGAPPGRRDGRQGGLGGRLLRVRVCRLRGSHRDHDDPQPPRPRPGHARRAGRRHPPGTSGTPVDGHARGRLDEPVARLPAAAPRRRDPSRCRKLMGRARTERPTRAATLAVYGRRGRRRACDLLARECSRHGVPFTTNGITMLINAPPGSPYRVATPRHRR